MTRLVHTWQQHLPLEDFCRQLGIPEDESPYLNSVYAEVVGVSAAFVHLTGPGESEQWSRHWWSKRAFCKALGMPGGWAGSLTNFSLSSRDGTVEIRFVR